MKIRTQGLPTTDLQKRVRHAAKYFASKLIPDYQLKTLEVKIIFDPIRCARDECLGEVWWVDRKDKPRKYTMLIDPASNIARVLAHEFVHIKQYVLGQMIDQSKGLVVWKRRVIKDASHIEDRAKYKALPWEKEAYGKERKLLKKYRRDVDRSLQIGRC